MLNLNFSQIVQSIEQSQHCQRNWDLSKTIPEEHIDLFIQAVKRAPSKQNVAFYKTHFITNRNLIETIAQSTRRNNNYRWQTGISANGPINSQVLSNLLVVFEYYGDYSDPTIHNRNSELKTLHDNLSSNGYNDKLYSRILPENFQLEEIEKFLQENNIEEGREKLRNYIGSYTLRNISHMINRDRYYAIAIAAGYVSLLANMLGYATGFCQCMQSNELKELFETNTDILLLLGVGHPIENYPHNVQNLEDVSNFYPKLSKQEILVNRIK